MALHEITPERATLHGYFSRDLPPCLTIQPGDTVRFQTLEANWTLAQRTGTGDAPKFEPRGEGAEPGMTLEIQIGDVTPGDWGYTNAGGWSSLVNDALGVAGGEGIVHLWALGTAAMTGRNQHGHEVGLRPFLGVMGMPADVPGNQSTAPPRVTGGNLDCKELVAGSSLFLPVAVRGGLFSAGDGHAAQGDGEVSGLAIECPMERVDLTFHLHPSMTVTTPRAKTPAGWITLGVGTELEEAMKIALSAMLDLMGEMHGLTRQDALALASVAVDLRITQVVNGVVGVHALLPDGALKMPA